VKLPASWNISLRAQLALTLSLFLCLAFGAGASFWLLARRASSDRELLIASRLDALRTALHEVDDLADRYLLTGDPAWLERRRPLLERASGVRADLGRLMTGTRAAPLQAGLDVRASRRLAREEAGLALRRQGRLPPARARVLADDQRALEALDEYILRLRQMNLDDVQARQQDLWKSSRNAFLLAILACLAACALLGLVLTVFISAPIRALEKYARAWSLGEPWEHVPAHASQELHSLAACMREMTAQINQRYERERELNLFKSRLVALVSHEFNNSLTIIDNCTSRLNELEGDPNPLKKEETYRMLSANVRSLGIATTNLLGMARLETSRFSITLQRVDLRAVITEAVERLELLYRRKRQTLTLHIPDEPLLVRADPQGLAMVITNLLSNAIKYTPKEGSITIGLEPVAVDPGRALTYVRDTGIGISPEDQVKIFQGYYRTKAGQRSAKGFGVGLFLARNILEAHGSQLQVESQPESGSNFYFTLPVWRSEAPAPGPAAGAGQAAAKP